jgi:2,5-diketo-D-gluconate reductase B
MNLPAIFETLLKLKQQGRTRAIGVANFNLALLKTAVEEVKAPIACNQIEYHVMLDQTKLAKYLAAKSIPLVAYAPLAQGRAASDETLISIGRKHGASAAQVALKWLLEQNGVAAIPKASRAQSQQANLDALKLKLDDGGQEGHRGAAEGQALCKSRFRAGVGLAKKNGPLRGHFRVVLSKRDDVS